jgi:hypothetical protein
VIGMRTLIFIACGFLLWGATLGAAKLFAGANSSSMSSATIAFIAVWFVAAAVNLWVGVTRAGYSIAEELPIFLAIFMVPALYAVLVKWKWL